MLHVNCISIKLETNKTQGEYTLYEPRRGGLKNPALPVLDLGYPTSQTVRNKFLLFKPKPKHNTVPETQYKVQIIVFTLKFENIYNLQ